MMLESLVIRPKLSGSFRKAVALSVLALASSCGGARQLAKVVGEGHERTLRDRPSQQPSEKTERPTLLIIAIDGVGRDFLYGMLARGELPELAALLGGSRAGFPHAYFAPDVLTTLPSTTGVAWATLFTAVKPAVHGFAGNEFFIRETRRFAAPIPVSVAGATEALSVFTEGYANRFLSVPTIYETMRSRDPRIKIWVSMSQFYRGADELLMTRRSVLVAALEAFVSGHTSKDLPLRVWADLDREDVSVVVDKLDKEPAPDVLTVYLFGTDDWAHVAPEGPDTARHSYLAQVLDPALGELRRKLEQKHALDNRYVVLTARSRAYGSRQRRSARAVHAKYRRSARAARQSGLSSASFRGRRQSRRSVSERARVRGRFRLRLFG